MAMTAAEKQRRYRERIKAKLRGIEERHPVTPAQRAVGVATGALLLALEKALLEEALPEDRKVEAAALEATRAWLKLAAIAPDIFPADDVLRISLLADDLQKKVARVRSSSDFTPREMAVLLRLREGKPNRVIAEEIRIGEDTVKVLIRRLLIKLRAKNRTQAALTLRNYVPAEQNTHEPDEAA
jgi:DNA-binding CsgD family transcriptional regulator